jgi:PilZ domain
MSAPHVAAISTQEAVCWRATYTYEANGFRYTDEASLRDVSQSGCGIRGRTCLAVGSKTLLTFHLQDGQRPLSVRARVTGVIGDVFRIQFLNLRPEDYKRMQHFSQQALNDPGRGVPPPILKERRKRSLRLALVWLFVVGSLWGCATVSAPVSGPVAAPSVAFFTPTPEERVNLALRASELDAVVAECAAENTCDEHVHFSRALVSLFENREAARASFQKVVSLNPTSPLANSSALWLQLLNHDGDVLTDSSRALVMDLTTQWLRQWMARPMAPPSSAERTPHPAKPSAVQALHQQVRERDRHIARLRAQLDALKVINQDQEERRKMRPPALFVPKVEAAR